MRNESERRPRQLVDKLKQAEEQLSALRQQLSGLRQRIAQAEKTPKDVNQNQLQQLNEQQQNVRRDIEQLARQLERLQAADASQSAQKAASGLENRPANGKQEANGQRPSPSSQVQKSEQQLEQAARQLAERRSQAEDDLALEFVRRFQTELGEMVQRQQRVIKKTDEFDAGRLSSPTLSTEQSKTVSDLADEERQLAQMAKEHSEILFGLGSVRVSLEDAERRLAAAGKLLDDQQTGSPAKSAEQLALARLEAMMQAFAQTASEAGPKPNANQNSNANPANGAANSEPPQRKPTFELLEVKMLRMLQADLNERTREHEQRLNKGASNPAATAALQQEELELAVEQGQLAELVQKMLARDNKKQEP